MKWVAYALVLVNVGYFSWQLRNLTPVAPREATEVPMRAVVNRLLLVSEVDQEELRERTLAPAKPAELSPPHGGVDESDTAGAGGGAAQPPAEPVGAPPMVAAVSPEVAESSESPDVPSPPDPDPLVIPGPEAGDGSSLCYSIGPLLTPEEVAAMAKWIEDRNGKGVLRQNERRETALYWVYFPPLPSRKDATARVKQMKADGIDDIFLIPGGDQANAISLGVYSRRTSLARRLEQLRGRGYEPSVAPRYRTRLASWYDAEFSAGFEFPRAAFARAFPSAEMAPSGCPGASGTEGAGEDAQDGAGGAAQGATQGDTRGNTQGDTQGAVPASEEDREYSYSTATRVSGEIVGVTPAARSAAAPEPQSRTGSAPDTPDAGTPAEESPDR